MSSRVYDGDAGTAVRMVPWRENPQKQKAPEPVAAKSQGPPAEVVALRAEIEALSGALDQRAQEAWQQGFRAGETAARQTLEGEIRAMTEKLAGTIAEVASLRPETIRRAEADTVRLSIEIARRVLHRELSVDSSALEALIKAALEKLGQQEVYRVRVGPGEEKLMRACLAEAGRGQAIEVVSDPAQARGGVLFEISRGSLDASVDTQLREIERGLTDELRTRT